MDDLGLVMTLALDTIPAIPVDSTPLTRTPVPLLDAESPQHLVTAIKVAVEVLFVLLATIAPTSRRTRKSKSRSYQRPDQWRVNVDAEAASNPMPYMPTLRAARTDQAGSDLWYSPRAAAIPLLPAYPHRADASGARPT